MDEKRNIADSLDPVQYASHVTRTAILLEQLARDVSALREETERSSQGANGLRTDFARFDRSTAVFQESVTARIGVNETAIHDLTERLRWLGRLVIGSLITGVLSGLLAFAFRVASK